MEARKIQITGGSTYTVSLPKTWAREMRLEAGDMVFLEPVGDTIVLRRGPVERRERRTTVLPVEREDEPNHVLRRLIGAYVTGHQDIELRFAPTEAAMARDVAREFSRMVIGAEVVEETGGRVLIQDLANPMELSADKYLRRMYMTVRSMAEDSVTALRTGDTRQAEDVPPRDQDVDRLCWMVAKQNHLAVSDPSFMATYELRAKLQYFTTVAKLLERIGDHAEKIATAALRLKEGSMEEDFLKKVEDAVDLALALLDKAFTSLMADDLDMANEALDSWPVLARHVDELSEHVSGVEGARLLPLATVVDSVSRIGGYASDIAEVAINVVMSQEA